MNIKNSQILKINNCNQMMGEDTKRRQSYQKSGGNKSQLDMSLEENAKNSQDSGKAVSQMFSMPIVTSFQSLSSLGHSTTLIS